MLHSKDQLQSEKAGRFLPSPNAPLRVSLYVLHPEKSEVVSPANVKRS